MSTKLSLALLVLFSCMSCGKDEAKQNQTCYLQAFENFKEKTDAVKIDEYTLKGETVYFMDDAAYTYDGLSYYINANCDSLCSMGGLMLPNPCVSDLKFVKLIWKK